MCCIVPFLRNSPLANKLMSLYYCRIRFHSLEFTHSNEYYVMRAACWATYGLPIFWIWE